MARGPQRRQNEEVDSEWGVTLLAAAALVVGVAGAAARAARRGAEWQARVEEAWEKIAERAGGTLEVGTRALLSPRRLRISREVEGVRASVETTVPVEQSSLAHTRAHARYALGGGPTFRLADRSVQSESGLEAQVLVDSRLAGRAILLTEEPVATAIAFTPAACSIAADFSRPLALRADGRSIELAWDRVELDEEVLLDALALLGEIAQNGVGVLRSLAAIEGATYSAHDPQLVRPAVRVQRGPILVVFLAKPSVRGPRYVARAIPSRASVPTFEVEVGSDGAIEGELPATALDSEDAGLFARIGRGTLRASAMRVELAWEESPSLAQAEAAASLVASIAAGSTRRGAFR
jgi:hypothetical protein